MERESIMFLKHKDITYRITREESEKMEQEETKKNGGDDKVLIYLYIHGGFLWQLGDRGVYYKTSAGEKLRREIGGKRGH